MTIEEIAEDTGLSLETIEEMSKGLVMVQFLQGKTVNGIYE